MQVFLVHCNKSYTIKKLLFYKSFYFSVCTVYSIRIVYHLKIQFLAT